MRRAYISLLVCLTLLVFLSSNFVYGIVIRKGPEIKLGKKVGVIYAESEIWNEELTRRYTKAGYSEEKRFFSLL
jgi:hypothetical protein